MPEAKLFKVGDILTITREGAMGTGDHIKYGEKYTVTKINGYDHKEVFLDRCGSGKKDCSCLSGSWMMKRFKLVFVKAVKISAKELKTSDPLPTYDVLEGFLKKSGMI